MSGSRAANRFRPGLECFEDRTTPSVVTAAAIADAHEGGTAGTIRFSRTDTAGSLSVGFDLSGTATAWSDYSPPFSVTFGNGAATVDVTVAATNDTTSEETETVTFTVHVGVDYTVGTPASATINIFDNDAQVVSVAKIADAAEGGANGTLQFTRTGDLSSSLTANISVGGTATSGTDYTALGTTVTFAANSATTNVTVTPTDDTVYDVNETVTATVASGTGYTVGSSSAASVNIADSISATVTLGSYIAAIKYQIPWGSVDPSAATQSLTPTSFNLNLAGYDYAYGIASFSTAPTLQFAYGDLVGISFALNLTGAGSPYSSISVASRIATAVDAANGQFIAAPVVDQTASVYIDFSTITIPTAADGVQEVKIRVTAADGTVKVVTVEIQPGATKTQVRNAFKTALTAVGFNAVADGDNGLQISGTTGANPSQLQKVETFNFGATPPKLGTRTAGPNGAYPTYTNNN